MIDSPHNFEHPAFSGQQDFNLQRAVVDTGDENTPASVVLTFIHRKNGIRRRFSFSGIRFAVSIGRMTEVPGYLPMYVATVEGRGWEPPVTIEVGDTDPGGEWFWAQAIQEVTIGGPAAA